MSAPLNNTLPTQRINYLDSVRGLAALAVVFYHFIGWRWDKAPDKLLQFNLTSLVFNGSDAVSLFFVLSGLVLSWKYFYPNESLVIDGPHYREYVLNRVVRLYLPFLAALLLVYYYSIHHHGDNLVLVSEFVTNKFGWMEEALLIRGKHDLYLPGWTLEVEMVGSLLLPFLVLLLRYNRQLFVMLLAVLLVLGSVFFMSTLGHFMLGMLLTYYFPRIAGYHLRQSKLYPFRFLLYLLVFALFSARHLTRIYPLGELANYWLGMLRLDLFHFTGLGSFGILAYIINSPRLQRFLVGKPLLFLGRISYSVYLVHWYFVGQVMNDWDKYSAPFTNSKVAFLVLLAATVTATLLFATVFNVLFERPAIRLGKRLGARFAPRPQLVPTPVAQPLQA